MAVCSKHHLELDANGVGKCSVPMWSGGGPDGFCDKPAYGKPIQGNGYDGYVPGLACPRHGGPKKPENPKPVVVIPLDQWRHLAELSAAWNSGDCCAAIADDMAGIIAKIREEAERG